MTASAFAGATNNWKAEVNANWHLWANWSFFQVPTATHEVWLQPYAGPNPALIFVQEAPGTARALSLTAMDWNCAIEGCDYDALVQGIPGPGGRARLHVDTEIRSTAEHNMAFGAGESNLTFLSLDVRAQSIVTDESNGADATMKFADARVVITGSENAVTVGALTEMTLQGSHFEHDAPASVFDFVVAPGATLLVSDSWGESTLRDCDLIVAGSLFCTSTLRTDVIENIGTTLLNGNLVVDGDRDSFLYGIVGGTGTLTKQGTGTLSLAGPVKTQLGGLTLGGGIVETSSADQLGAGDIRLAGGSLRSIDTPFSITTQPIVAQSAGEIVTDVALAIHSSISGPGVLVKSGADILALHGSASYAGGTQVEGGTLEVNAASGTGSGPVYVGNDATLAGSGSVSGAITLAGGATLAPGTASTIESLGAGSVDFDGGSTFAVRLSGTGPGAFDRLAATGVTIDPGSTLAIALSGGYTPQPGDAFTVLASANVGGIFDAIAGPPGPWCIEPTAQGLVLRFDASCDPVPPCPADIDGSGAVSTDDLVAVIVNWGVCDGCAADVTGDGVVNVDDLTAVIIGWGTCE